MIRTQDTKMTFLHFSVFPFIVFSFAALKKSHVDKSVLDDEPLWPYVGYNLLTSPLWSRSILSLIIAATITSK